MITIINKETNTFGVSYNQRKESCENAYKLWDFFRTHGIQLEIRINEGDVSKLGYTEDKTLIDFFIVKYNEQTNVAEHIDYI